MVVPEEFEFVPPPCSMLSRVGSLWAADERLSQPCVLQPVMVPTASPGHSCVRQASGGTLVVEEKVDTHDTQAEYLANGSILVVEEKVGTHDTQAEYLANGGCLSECRGSLDEDFNICPRSGQLNILTEEEEVNDEEEVDDEESETEFWFERSVNEKDEERFTLRAGELAQSHSESDINLISPCSEKIDDRSDSDKDLRIMCERYKQSDRNSIGLLGSEPDSRIVDPETDTAVGNHLDEGANDVDDVRCNSDYSSRDHCSECSNSFGGKQNCPLCSLMHNPANNRHISATSFVSRPQVHFDVDVEKGRIGLYGEEDTYRVGVNMPASGVPAPPGEAKRGFGEPSSVLDLKDLVVDDSRCTPSNTTSAGRQVRMFSTKDEIILQGDHRLDQVEEIPGYDFKAEKPEMGPCDGKCTENTDTQNLVQNKHLTFQQSLQNEGELYCDLDLDLESLTFPLACMSSDLNLSEFGLAPDQGSCQGDGSDDLVSGRRKTNSPYCDQTSVEFTGFDHPGFFSKAVPGEAVDEDSMNRRFFGSCDADTAVCYLNSGLPSVTIEECISDNDASDEDSFEGRVGNHVYEEVDRLAVINTVNTGENGVVGGKVNDFKNGKNDDVFGFTSDGKSDVRSHADMSADVVCGHRGASADVHGDVARDVNQNPRPVWKCTVDLNHVNKDDVDSACAVDARLNSNSWSETSGSIDRLPKSHDDKSQTATQPISSEIRNNILRSPLPFIEAFEQEVRQIYSKRGNASPDFITDVSSNLSEGNCSICDSGLENGFVVSDVGVDDEGAKDSSRSRSEKKDSSTSSHEKIVGMVSDTVLLNSVSGERSAAYYARKSTVSGSEEKAGTCTLLKVCEGEGRVYSDELYTSYTECAIIDGDDDDEDVCRDLPPTAVSEVEKNTEAGANEMTQVNAGWQVKKTQVMSVSRKDEDLAGVGAGGPLRDSGETQAQVHREVPQSDMAVVNDGSGAELCDKYKDLFAKKFRKCFRLASPGLEGEQEAAMHDFSNGSPLWPGDGLMPCPVSDSAEALGPSAAVGPGAAVGPSAGERALGNVETETLMEPVELNIGFQIRDRSAAVTPESPSGTRSCIERPPRPPGSVARNVCLRLEPGQVLSRGHQPSDLSITSRVVMDDEIETVVCSNSFCSDSAQTTVTSTVNLLVPSLEIDIAIQKQNPGAVDGTLELGEASSDRERAGDGLTGQLPTTAQVIPTISGCDVRGGESAGQVSFGVSRQISYNDMLACALNFVDVLFWICLAVAIIVFDFRNWTT